MSNAISLRAIACIRHQYSIMLYQDTQGTIKLTAPIPPIPIIPTVLPSGSRAGCHPVFHLPVRPFFSAKEKFRRHEIVKNAPTVAVASSTAPGVCETSIPRAVAAATSTIPRQPNSPGKRGLKGMGRGRTLVVSCSIVGNVLD